MMRVVVMSGHCSGQTEGFVLTCTRKALKLATLLRCTFIHRLFASADNFKFSTVKRIRSCFTSADRCVAVRIQHINLQTDGYFATLFQLHMSLILFVFNNKSKFKVNSDVPHINARQKCNIHHTFSDLSLYKKVVYSVGIKVLNCLPQCIRNLSNNPKWFESALNNYLYIQCF